MIKKLLLAISVTILFSCSKSENSTGPESASAKPEKLNADAQVEVANDAETKRINEWFEARYEEELAFSPIQLTFLGRKELYDQIDDASMEAYEKKLAWQKQTVEQMKSEFDYKKLSPEAKTSYDLWQYRYEIDEEGRKYKLHDYIFEQMNGAHTFLPTFIISFHKVDTEADMQAYISRINGIGRGIKQLLVLTQDAAKQSIRPPKFAFEIVKDEAIKLISGRPFTETGDDSPIWADAKTKIQSLVDAEKISAENAGQLQNQAKEALLTGFKPAYEELIAFLDNDIANTTELPKGVGALPDGEAYYDYRLRRMTTTDLSAEDIHNLGLSEVKRLRAEMEKIKTETGFDGDLQAFFAMLRDGIEDRRFYYPDTDEGRQAYIDDATAAINNIKTRLPEYFGILPKADLVVKRVEAFREQAGAAQHYYPGTPDGSRPGTYYAHLSDMTAMPKNQLEVIAYHEGIPGHHMQISIAQELDSIPTFRRQDGFTAYVEGWALYAEYLASEMPNTYQDPYSRFGRLSSEIWRGIRLVVDTGLHAKGWSEQQAIDYFAANSPEPLESIRSEVRRYLVMPGQATSYKIGMLDILRLRDMARTSLGNKFDIRDFHDTVLSGGALPLSILDARVDKWLESYP